MFEIDTDKKDEPRENKRKTLALDNNANTLNKEIIRFPFIFKMVFILDLKKPHSSKSVPADKEPRKDDVFKTCKFLNDNIAPAVFQDLCTPFPNPSGVGLPYALDVKAANELGKLLSKI